MKKILLTLFILMLSKNSIAQKTNFLINNWGEINEWAKTYRGKSGLVCVKLRADNTFSAFQSSCTGSMQQNGTWKRKGKTITFTVIESVFNPKTEEHEGWRGKILEERKGVIAYKIELLSQDELIFYNEKLNKKFIFKPTDIGR